MESESLPPLRPHRPAIRWADLPPELLATIADRLQNSTDIFRFRAVCRSWKLSISPRNIISLLFPHKVSSCSDTIPQCDCRDEYVIAGAVYLLRPFTDPSKVWIVSAQESTAGKLLLRHALTYEKILGLSGKSIELSEWSVNCIATSYRFLSDSDQVKRSKKNCSLKPKIIFPPNSKTTALLNHDRVSQLFVVRSIIQVIFSIDLHDLQDFVNFNGRIYAADRAANIYSLNSITLQPLKMNRVNFTDPLPGEDGYVLTWRKRFVLSDGDLYLFFKVSEAECRIYRLLMNDADATCCSFERVENLGDRVFFINPDCCFSILARDLPRPVKGNCVVSSRKWFSEYGPEIVIYHLGKAPQFGIMSSLQVYSALFIPPSWWINQLRRVQPETKEGRERSCRKKA